MDNIFEFQAEMRNLFCKKFTEQFESKGAFINCRVTDKEVYSNSNKSMYSFYIKIANQFDHLFDHWEFKIADYGDLEFAIAERFRMYESLQNSTHVILWAFENIEIR
mgnify:CR=1 FL=1